MPDVKIDRFDTETKRIEETVFVENDSVLVGERPTHVVTMVHGIRDLGFWAEEINYKIKQLGLEQKYGLRLEVVCARYSRVSAFLFLFSLLGRRAINTLRTQVRQIFEINPSSSHFLFAHSYGAKLVFGLAKHTESAVFFDSYKAVFLCGSVAKSSDVEHVTASYRNKKKILNDCSPIDKWPWLAELLNPWQYSASGVYGLASAFVINRFFEKHHGEFTKTDYFIENVLPIIARGPAGLRQGDLPRTAFSPHHLPYLRRALVFLLIIGVGVCVYLCVGPQ